jgi:predicted enzyme related to lactoylglutathione lyase
LLHRRATWSGRLAVAGAAALITGTDFVTLPANDFAASCAFYEEVLGLACSARWGADPLGAEYETGNLTLAVVDSARLGIEFRPQNHPVALHVHDVPAARAALEALGVPFLGQTIDSGVCLMAHFTDPAGNVLMLHHRYAPKPPRP